MHVCMYVCMSVCVCMYACMHVCIYGCMHVCMHVCIHASMHACMHVCMYVCVYIYIHNISHTSHTTLYLLGSGLVNLSLHLLVGPPDEGFHPQGTQLEALRHRVVSPGTWRKWANGRLLWGIPHGFRRKSPKKDGFRG